MEKQYVPLHIFLLYHSQVCSISLGSIDASTVAKVVKEVTEEEKRRQALVEARPPLDNIINLHDFEQVARVVLPEKAWVRSSGYNFLPLL